MGWKSIAVMSLAAVLALAPQAFALGGSGGTHGVSGSVNITSTGSNSGNFSGNVGGTNVSGTISGDGSSGTFSGSYSSFLSAPEPISAFAVGLGLLGARMLRRRRS